MKSEIETSNIWWKRKIKIKKYPNVHDHLRDFSILNVIFYSIYMMMTLFDVWLKERLERFVVSQRAYSLQLTGLKLP